MDNDGTLLRPRSLAETLASSWEWYHEKHNKADRAALFRGDLQHDAVSTLNQEEFAHHRRRLFRTPGHKGAVDGRTFGIVDAEKVLHSERAAELRHATCLFLDNGFMVGFENTDTFSGGAIAIERKGEFIVQGCRFDSNLAASAGGAISARGRSIVLVSDSILLRNSAQTGGGMFLGDEAQVALYRNFFYQNRADLSGGGLRTAGKSSLQTSDLGFVENMAGVDGGSMSFDRGISRLTICGWKEDLSTEDPKFMNECTIRVRETLHRANKAEKKGGGVYMNHLLCKYRMKSRDVAALTEIAEKRKIFSKIYEAPAELTDLQKEEQQKMAICVASAGESALWSVPEKEIPPYVTEYKSCSGMDLPPEPAGGWASASKAEKNEKLRAERSQEMMSNPWGSDNCKRWTDIKVTEEGNGKISCARGDHRCTWTNYEGGCRNWCCRRWREALAAKEALAKGETLGDAGKTQDDDAEPEIKWQDMNRKTLMEKIVDPDSDKKIQQMEKYEDEIRELDQYALSHNFPNFYWAPCASVNASEFISNRATAGYGIFWEAQHGREDIPVCEGCNKDELKKLGTSVSPVIECDPHDFDDRVKCQRGGLTLYQVPDVLCSNCTAIAPEVASSTLGVSYGGFPKQMRSGIPAAEQGRTPGPYYGQIAPYVITVDYYGQLSPLDDTTQCSLRRASDANVSSALKDKGTESSDGLSLSSSSKEDDEKTKTTVLPGGAVTKANLVVIEGTGVSSKGRVTFKNVILKGDIGTLYFLTSSCEGHYGVNVQGNVTIGNCAPGEALDKQRVCKECPVNTYSPRGQACLECPPGGNCTRSEYFIGGVKLSSGVDKPSSLPGYWLHPAPTHLSTYDPKGYCDFKLGSCVPGGKRGSCTPVRRGTRPSVRRARVPTGERPGSGNTRRRVPFPLYRATELLSVPVGADRVQCGPKGRIQLNLQSRVSGPQVRALRSQSLENGGRYMPSLCGHGWKNERSASLRSDGTVCHALGRLHAISLPEGGQWSSGNEAGA